MGKNFYIKSLSIILFCGILPRALAQQEELDPKIFFLYDQLVGLENTNLFNGREYIEEHRMIDEKHKFFDSFDYVPGVVVYDNEIFYNVDLKYNIFEDLLLVQLNGSRGKTRFSLYKEDLNGFRLNGHNFINIKEPGVPYSRHGIYEVILAEEQLKLLKKHNLIMKKILDGQLLHHEFEKDEPDYFYFSEGKLFEADSKNLYDIFPAIKEEIRSFYRKNRRLRRNEPGEFHKRLFNQISSLTTTR